MLNKCEVEKEKLKLMKSLLNISDGDLTFLSMKTKISYSRIWYCFHWQTMTDKNILDAIFFMHQMLLHAYSTDYKTFKNAWNNYNMFVQSISEDKFLELQNRASEIMKSFGYIEKKGDKV